MGLLLGIDYLLVFSSCTLYYTRYCGFVKWRIQNVVVAFLPPKKYLFRGGEFAPPSGQKMPFLFQSLKETFEMRRRI